MPVRGSAGTEGKGMSASGGRGGGRRAERTSSSCLLRGTCAGRSGGVRGERRAEPAAVLSVRCALPGDCGSGAGGARRVSAYVPLCRDGPERPLNGCAPT